jgi:hypothetical protein
MNAVITGTAIIQKLRKRNKFLDNWRIDSFSLAVRMIMGSSEINEVHAYGINVIRIINLPKTREMRTKVTLYECRTVRNRHERVRHKIVQSRM